MEFVPVNDSPLPIAGYFVLEDGGQFGIARGVGRGSRTGGIARIAFAMAGKEISFQIAGWLTAKMAEVK